MKIYLAHSVHERDRGKEVQGKLEAMGHEVYNPFYPDDIIRGDIEAIEKGDIMPWDLVDRTKSNLVCERDLEGVRQSDIVICLYPDGRTVHEENEKLIDAVADCLYKCNREDLMVDLMKLLMTMRTVGIPCEMFFAGHCLHMDVYSSAPKDMEGHPWIVNYSKVVFTSDKDLLEYIKVAKIRMFY